ncbi:DUF4411 family protein [Herbaspirillum sp. CAH-3]|uniref:DUF4411 family protein n=1 Tax=Herbaspirillum sp. CAH-3 TaxID=2605746 RepID=UPI0012ACA7B9|nr:DUF4411 family protein [Herbaspirillum sp. CAH-3]MRT29331.1 DUF4411 family protein [Herbaspirillum sp. CAH-3]
MSASSSVQLYLLDANVLIDAHNKYYAVDMVPEFWEWLLHSALSGRVAMPLETFEEVKGGPNAKKDGLNEWLHSADVEKNLVLPEEFDGGLLQRVMDTYAPDLTDVEVEQVGRDPFLIAYCLADPASRCVVSNEVSKPAKQRANQKVPDVSRKVGVECCDTFAMLRRLGFKTGWKAGT